MNITMHYSHDHFSLCLQQIYETCEMLQFIRSYYYFVHSSAYTFVMRGKINIIFSYVNHTVHNVYTECTQCVHRMYTMCTHNVHNVYTECTQCVHIMYTMCTQNVHNVYTECTQCVHRMCTNTCAR